MTVLKSATFLCRREITNVQPSAKFVTGVFCRAAAPAAKENPHHRNRENFDRHKLFINLGTLGAPHHGKTTLTSAITRVLSQSPSENLFRGPSVPFLDIGDIDHTALEKDSKHSQNTKHLEWWTDDWFVAHSDLPGLTKHFKNTLAPLPLLDAVILCISADQGVAKETLLHYHVAKHFGVPTILPFINVSGDADLELVDFVKMELEETVAEEDMNRLVVGNAASAQKSPIPNLAHSKEKYPVESESDDAAVASLLDSLKKDLKLRQRDCDAPFLLHVESSGDIPNKGLFTGGRIAQGTAKAGDHLEVFVGGITSKVVYKDVEIFKRITPELRAGDRGGGFLKKDNKIVEIRRGSLIYAPETVKSDWKASRNWKVKGRGIPGQGSVNLTNRAFIYHRGNNESVSLAKSCATSDKYDSVIDVTSRQEILAKVGDPVVLRSDYSTFLGYLVEE